MANSSTDAAIVDNGEAASEQTFGEEDWTVITKRKIRRRDRKGKNVADEVTGADAYSSVFSKQSWAQNASSSDDLSHTHFHLLTTTQYEEVVQSVKQAVASGIQPVRIIQGSSGSYFVRNLESKVVAIFKPKDEVKLHFVHWKNSILPPCYAKLNPKWAKWCQRTFLPCMFGRSCLISNLGYVSEAAASLIDRRLNICLVPPTNLVHLASPAFHYPASDRRATSDISTPIQLPPKIGSFQLFLEGFQGADVWLREHPFPSDSFFEDETPLTGNDWNCFTGGIDEDGATFRWTKNLQIQFKEELQKLAILDYLIRNTDRGLDNWMIKYCEHGSRCTMSQPPIITEGDIGEREVENTMTNGFGNWPHIHIAAIDNGLAFPFKHPDQWRSYPYGWLSLPSPFLAAPFTSHVRSHFLPLLSSPEWWAATVEQLRALFECDLDFDEGMFDLQMSVLKGNGWNIVQALQDPKAGVIDLIRRERAIVIVEEQVVEFEDNRMDAEDIAEEPRVDDGGNEMNDDDGISGHSKRHSRSMSSATSASIPSRKWGKFKSKLSSLEGGLGIGGRTSKEHERKLKIVVLTEKVERVKGNMPFFACC